MDKIEEIVDIPLDPFMPDAIKLASIQKDAAVAAVNLAQKIDENRFRQRNDNAVLRILEKITAAERAQVIN